MALNRKIKYVQLLIPLREQREGNILRINIGPVHGDSLSRLALEESESPTLCPEVL